MMAASEKVINFLKNNNVDFELMEHSAAYTAQEIAGKQHIPGRLVIKSVIIKLDGKLVMCVLPAIHLVDFEVMRNLSGATDVRLATEEEIAETFPDYEVGAEPPFGHLYGLETYADKFLEQDEYVAFNAGTHTDMIKIKREEFMKLSKPTVAEFGVHI
ncbi:MAG: YbaK/EbsC family protein [Chlamydiota bacterium]|nr:YbaK/EbsC family protein [Chlamydiota bacterium]